MPDLDITPAQRAVLDILSDGLRHHVDELVAVMPQGGGRSAVRFKLNQIRKQLRPRGHDIICEFWERRLYYRHVRLLNSGE